MFHLPNYVQQLQKDVRQLRVHNSVLKRSHLLQKQKADDAQDQLNKKDQQIKELVREKKKLEGGIGESKAGTG